MRTLMQRSRGESGFTLVELIMVIVLMGIVGGMVAVFMKRPFDAYIDSARRAALTDVADTVVRRMARDIRKALPASIVSPNNQCIEFIPTRTGGRYRATAPGNAIDFGVADTSFNMLGDNNPSNVSSTLPTDQRIQVGDLITIAGADPRAGANTATVAAPAPSRVAVTAPNFETSITIVSTTFTASSEDTSHRFQVIPKDEKVVSYICSGGKLYRNANYAYSPTCPAPIVGTTPIIATVASCDFVYSPLPGSRNALVQLNLVFSDSSSGEAVSLYHEVHVDNSQ